VVNVWEKVPPDEMFPEENSGTAPSASKMWGTAVALPHSTDVWVARLIVKGFGEKAPAPEEETMDTSEPGGGLLPVESLLQAATARNANAMEAVRMGTSRERVSPAER
jgi:hypothetical protein